MSLFAGKPFLLSGFIILCKDRLLLKFHVLEVRYSIIGSLTIHAISCRERYHLADNLRTAVCAVRTKDALAKKHGLSLRKELNTLVALGSAGLFDNFLDFTKANRLKRCLLLVILTLDLIVDTGIVQHVAIVDVEAVDVGIRITVVRTPAGIEDEVNGV